MGWRGPAEKGVKQDERWRKAFETPKSHANGGGWESGRTGGKTVATKTFKRLSEKRGIKRENTLKEKKTKLDKGR